MYIGYICYHAVQYLKSVGCIFAYLHTLNDDSGYPCNLLTIQSVFFMSLVLLIVSDIDAF